MCREGGLLMLCFTVCIVLRMVCEDVGSQQVCVCVCSGWRVGLSFIFNSAECSFEGVFLFVYYTWYNIVFESAVLTLFARQILAQAHIF